MMKTLVSSPFLLLLLFLSSLPSSSLATNNITAILASHPDFSTFSSLCTQTGVASQIYARRTVTVLAVPNSILHTILQGSTFSASTLYDVISYHVLLDYFDIAKFQAILNHTALSATLLQTSGQVTGNEGYVNITVEGSTVHLGRAGSGLLTSTVVSEIYKSPYNISVVSVSNALLPAGVGAPEPTPAPVNFTSILQQAKVYTTFLSLIKSTGVDKLLLKHDTPPGVTIFAPDDGAFEKLAAGVLGNLTTAEQVALLEFHCLPSFFAAQELATLTTPQITLASGSGGGTYQYTSIALTKGGMTVINTGFNKVPVGPTLYSQEPLGLYGIPTILMPTDLFGSAPAPAPAPSPTPAMSPSPSPSSSPAPAPSSLTPAGAPEPVVASPPAPRSKSNSTSSSESSAAQSSTLPLARGLMVTLLSCVVLFFTFL